MAKYNKGSWRSHTLSYQLPFTLGPIDNAGLEFLSDLGRRISQVSYNDHGEIAFSFQRLSVIIPRFNVVSIQGTSTTHPLTTI